MPVPENPVYHRRNYLLAATEGGFFMGGMAFLSMESVMPAMIHELGGAAWAVSIAPVLFYVGFAWPQIFSALWVERLQRMKPIVIATGYIQRIPYLATGLFLLFLGKEHPLAAVTLAFVTPFVMSTISGIQGSAYFELLTRMVPVNRIASMWAIRNVMWAVFGIIAGFIIKFILDRYPGVTGFGILHLCTYLMMMISIVLFSFVKEDNIPDHRALPPLSFREGFASVGRNLRANPSLIRFIVTRILFTTIFVVIPFLSIRAIEQTGESAGLVGMLVLTQMIGFISGNVVAGYLGDRMGTRIPMIIARLSLLAAVLWVPFAIEVWQFLSVFFLLGFGLSNGQVGDLTMVFDFAPVVRRKFYFAVMSVLLVPGILGFSIVSAILQYQDNGFLLACLASTIGLGISLVFLMGLKEPRQSKVAS